MSGARARKNFCQQHIRADTRLGIDLHLVHEAVRADDADAHAGGGLILPAHYVGEICNARTLVADADQQQLRRTGAFEREFNFAALRVAECIAHDFRHGGRNSRLVLAVETDNPGNLAGTLPRDHDVLLLPNRHGEKSFRHFRPAPYFSAQLRLHRRCRDRDRGKEHRQ